MLNHRVSKKNFNIKFQRFSNRFLYFIAFKLPLTSSYSNRTLVNYFNILITRDSPRQKKKIIIYDFFINIKTCHNLLINNIFKFYL
jgi:hypothetical protein